MNFTMSGQSINDRITAARHSLAGQGLAKSVCKATTEEIIGPKKKHLDYLLHCTNEPNVSIPQLANLLIERTQHSSWVVVFKALITIHHLMCYGNERFTQYLASSNCTFQLSNFLDKGGVQGYDMSTFIRRYAKYLNEKACSYRTVAFDFCKVKRGKDDGVMRTLSSEKLLKTLPVLQNQLDALLEFDCTPNELTNGVVNSCFLLMFRDLIRLFACYNDGIINLLEKYFDMNKKMCKEALDIYKKFLIRMDRVAEFLKVAENVGIDKGEIPDLAKAPGSLLDALEQHLASLEGKKIVGPSKAKPPDSLNTAVNTLNNTSNSFDAAAVAKIDATERKRLLEEEQARLNQLKLEDTEGWDNEMSWMVGSPGEQRLKELAQKEQTSPLQSIPQVSTNPFASPPAPSLDLFGSPTSAPPASRASDDLLSLSGNPFAANIESVMNATLYQQQQQNNIFNSGDLWTSSNEFSGMNNMTASYTSDFGSEAAFAQAFGSTTTTTTVNNFSAQASNSATPPIPLTVATGPKPSQKMSKEEKLIKGDIDSSLASLAQNLNINGPGYSVKKPGQQWNSPKNTGKTGGANWQPQIATATAPWSSPQHSYKPMGSSVRPESGLMGPSFTQAGRGSQTFIRPVSPVLSTGVGMNMGRGMGVGMGSNVTNSQPMQQNLFGSVASGSQATQHSNDPFGAL